MARAWGSLLAAVRTGEPAYAEVFGRPFWADLEANPVIAESFDALMGPAGHGAPDPDILPDGDWDSVRTVADVGGGTGALLGAILRERSHVSGILVDLPQTTARAEPHERLTVRAQSFFDPLPPGADVYVLKSVLGDWPDADAVRILRGCAEAAHPDGRVVIVGGGSPGPVSTDANLLMFVLVGGRERTAGELAELVTAAGLTVTATGSQRSGRVLTECRPS
jgi:SAM-dependent methyltransferase